MKKLGNAVGVIIGLALLIVTPYLLYKLVLILANNLDKISPNVVAALIAGLITVFGFFITRYFEKQKIIEQQIREKKIPIYESFVGFVAKIILNKGYEKIEDTDVQDFFLSFTERSMLWMSDETLQAYIKWRLMAINFDAAKDTKTVLFALEDVLIAFRKDIGHDTKNLKRGDLLATFINDIEKYLKE